YQFSLDADPELASAHYNLARLYSRNGDVASCLKHIDQVLQIEPQWAEDVAHDEHLKWALDMRNLRGDKGEHDNSEG
ncbi:MAG: tetratricopeptide repeat protein, partial [Chloroflexota bacterium]|nr:tetratricopeptide repeat protein [Chloroflexota bacterium]